MAVTPAGPGGAPPVDSGGTPPDAPGAPGGPTDPGAADGGPPAGAATDGGLAAALGGDLAGGTGSLTDLAAQNAINNINLTMATFQGAVGNSANQSMMTSTSDHAQATAEDHSDRFMDARASEGRAADHASLGEVLSSSDHREIMSYFANLSAGTRGESKTLAGNQGANQPNPNPSGNPNPVPGNPMGTGPNPTGTPTRTGTPTPPSPPIFPNAPGSAGTLTQPRLANLSGRIANMPEGTPKTQAQQLETRLRAAMAASPPDHEAAQAALDGLAAMGIEMGETGETDSLDDRAEVDKATEGDSADSPDGGSRTSLSGETGGAPRRVARTFTNDDLSRGVTVYASGDRGSTGEGEDLLTRMGTGLRLLAGGGATGFATRVATDSAVRGTYADGDGSRGDGGTGGGSNPNDPAAFGPMADPNGVLAARGFGIIETPGPMGNFAVLDRKTGRVYGLDDSRLPVDAQPGVRSWVGVGRGIRAAALSGHRAGITGDLHAGNAC